MKKSDLRKIVKEELLKELNYASMQRMSGLVNQKDRSTMLMAAARIFDDLVNEGFEEDEVSEYIIEKIKKHLKT